MQKNHDEYDKSQWKTTKLPPALHALIKSESAKMGISLTDMLEIILTDWLRRAGHPTPRPQSNLQAQKDFLISGIEDADAAHDRRASDIADRKPNKYPN